MVETGMTAEVVTKRVGWPSIGVSRRTKDDLDLIKHLGQSYDGLIRELIIFWKKEHGLEETVPVPSEVGQVGE